MHNGLRSHQNSHQRAKSRERAACPPKRAGGIVGGASTVAL
jgi:hypothetical protein